LVYICLIMHKILIAEVCMLVSYMTANKANAFLRNSISHLHTDVPKKVGGSTAKNLSVSIMFVCLLHLANEKNLVIKGSEAMNDLMIAQ